MEQPPPIPNAPQGYKINPHTGKIVRPNFLHVLCILSYIGGSLGLFGSLLNLLLHDMHISTYGYRGFMREYMKYSKELMEYAIPLGVIGVIFYTISIVGVNMMHKQKKMGFYLYTIVQIVLIFIPHVFVGFPGVSLVFLVWYGGWTTAFILMYRKNLYAMY